MYTHHFMSAGIAILAPVFAHRFAVQVFSHHADDSDDRKARMNTYRYTTMIMAGAGMVTASYYTPDNRTLVNGLGFAGVTCLVAAYSEYWGRLKDGVRTGMLGLAVGALVYYAAKL